MSFLLDTDVVSMAIRTGAPRRLLQRLAQHDGRCFMSAITWQELVFGVARLPDGAKKRALAEALADFRETLPPPLPFTVEAADWLGRELARLQRMGVQVGTADGQIAATAWSQSLALVTGNTKHFARIEGIDVVDWTR